MDIQISMPLPFYTMNDKRGTASKFYFAKKNNYEKKVEREFVGIIRN